MRRGAIVFAAIFCAFAHPAHAGPPRATAVELFAHGRALASEGRCEEAIAYFIDTLKLESSIGALLNLAECHEKLGHGALAYDRYREAERLAHDNADDREALARTRAEALASSLAKIVIDASPDAHVTIDGVAAQRGTNVVAEGDHVVLATLPHRAPFEMRVHASNAHPASVVVPQASEIFVLVEERMSDGHTQRVTGVAVALLGAASVVTGSVLGVIAIAKKSDEVTLSTGPSQQAFEDARATAKSFGDASTALFIAGGALAVAGIVIWITSPHARAATSAATPPWSRGLRVVF